MGIYVEFRPCDAEGPVRQILALVDQYADWYASEFADSASEAVLDLLVALQQRGPAALAELRSDQHATFDKLVTELYGYFCDARADLDLPPHVRCAQLRVQRYRELHEHFIAHASVTVATLWGYIVDGRPIAPAQRTSPFVSDDGASWVSWWSLDEIRALRLALPSSSFSTSELTDGVMEAVHCALAHALEHRCGLVITAF